MPRKKPRGDRAKPPVKPPTAVGTLPPSAPNAPNPNRVVCVTGGHGVGKSFLAAALARAWHERTSRPLVVGGPEKAETAKEADVFVEVPRTDEALGPVIRRAALTLWVLSGDPLECGFALGWLRRSRGTGGPAIGLVLNQTAGSGAEPHPLESVLRENDAAALARLPWTPDAEHGASGEALARALSPLLAELIRLLSYSEEEAARHLAMQLGVPYASRENRVLKVERDQGLEGLIGEDFAREHLVLPLFLDGKTLAVATTDLGNVGLLAERLTGLLVQPFIAPPGQIRAAIDDFYGEATGTRRNLDDVLAAAKETPVIVFINAVIKQAVSEKASAIHLEPNNGHVALRLCVNGVLYDRMPPPKELLPPIIARLKLLAKLDVLERRLPQEGTITVKIQDRRLDLRVSTVPAVGGEKIVMRLPEA